MIEERDFTIPGNVTAFLVSVVCPQITGHTTMEESVDSLGELRELLRTLEVKATEEFIQTKKAPEAATLIGKGKLEEISAQAKEANVKFLVFDFELSASQMKNIKQLTGLNILDRNNVILEIFAQHARTKEAKIQIEISRLKYLLPRLPSLWTHLSRQRGGIGVRSGEGEQQIELDRRMVRTRIEHFEKLLENIKKSRTEQKKRRNDRVITAALVGYTNAGKSSIMNRLCRENVLVEDKLFATLDATYRTLTPDTHPPMVLIDTVGFLSNLPSSLITGFRSTLESAIEADLLIPVCDISNKKYEKHIEVTKAVLEELGIHNKEILIVFNKRDALTNGLSSKIALKKYPGSFLVSSFDADDMKLLREHIIQYFLAKQSFLELFIPYEDGQAHAEVKARTNIDKMTVHETGVFYRVRVPGFMLENLSLKKYAMGPQEK